MSFQRNPSDYLARKKEEEEQQEKGKVARRSKSSAESYDVTKRRSYTDRRKEETLSELKAKRRSANFEFTSQTVKERAIPSPRRPAPERPKQLPVRTNSTEAEIPKAPERRRSRKAESEESASPSKLPKPVSPTSPTSESQVQPTSVSPTRSAVSPKRLSAVSPTRSTKKIRAPDPPAQSPSTEKPPSAKPCVSSPERSAGDEIPVQYTTTVISLPVETVEQKVTVPEASKLEEISPINVPEPFKAEEDSTVNVPEPSTSEKVSAVNVPDPSTSEKVSAVNVPDPSTSEKVSAVETSVSPSRPPRKKRTTSSTSSDPTSPRPAGVSGKIDLKVKVSNGEIQEDIVTPVQKSVEQSVNSLNNCTSILGLKEEHRDSGGHVNSYKYQEPDPVVIVRASPVHIQTKPTVANGDIPYRSVVNVQSLPDSKYLNEHECDEDEIIGITVNKKNFVPPDSVSLTSFQSETDSLPPELPCSPPPCLPANQRPLDSPSDQFEVISVVVSPIQSPIQEFLPSLDKHSSIETPVNTTADTPVDIPIDTPADIPVDVPVDTRFDTPVEIDVTPECDDPEEEINLTSPNFTEIRAEAAAASFSSPVMSVDTSVMEETVPSAGSSDVYYKDTSAGSSDVYYKDPSAGSSDVYYKDLEIEAMK